MKYFFFSRKKLNYRKQDTDKYTSNFDMFVKKKIKKLMKQYDDFTA